MIKLKLTTLTPLFIGSGKELESFEYVIIRGKFYKIDTNRILNYLIKNDKNALDLINNWIEDTVFGNNQAHNVNPNIYNLNVLKFVDKYLRNSNLLKDIKNKIVNGEFSFYTIQSFVQDNFHNKVISHIKTADNKIYIPGSTIKGMIRTALLVDYIQRMMLESPNEIDILLDLILKELNEIGNQPSNHNRVYFAKKINNEIFVCENESDQRLSIDLMKLIKVSDSNYHNPQEVCQLMHPILRKRNGQQTNNLNALEIIKPNAEFEFTLDFDISYFTNVYKKHSNTPLGWVKLEEKFEKLFQVQLKNLHQPNIKESLFETIKFAILNFNQFVAELDQKFQKTIGNLNTLNNVVRNINNNTIVTKLGWGGGYHSKTIYTLNFSDDYPHIELFKNLYQKIINKFRIGYSQNQNNRTQIDVLSIPATRKVVELNNFYEQLGWVKIERY